MANPPKPRKVEITGVCYLVRHEQTELSFPVSPRTDPDMFKGHRVRTEPPPASPEDPVPIPPEFWTERGFGLRADSEPEDALFQRFSDACITTGARWLDEPPSGKFLGESKRRDGRALVEDVDQLFGGVGDELLLEYDREYLTTPRPIRHMHGPIACGDIGLEFTIPDWHPSIVFQAFPSELPWVDERLQSTGANRDPRLDVITDRFSTRRGLPTSARPRARNLRTIAGSVGHLAYFGTDLSRSPPELLVLQRCEALLALAPSGDFDRFQDLLAAIHDDFGAVIARGGSPADMVRACESIIEDRHPKRAGEVRDPLRATYGEG